MMTFTILLFLVRWHDWEIKNSLRVTLTATMVVFHGQVRTPKWLDLCRCFSEVFTDRRRNTGLGHYNISLPVKVAVKLNILEDLKDQAVALLRVLQVILEVISMYHDRGKLINIYTRYNIVLLIKTTITRLLL